MEVCICLNLIILLYTIVYMILEILRYKYGLEGTTHMVRYGKGPYKNRYHWPEQTHT